MQWVIADSLGITPKGDPEKIGLAILILEQVASPSLSQGISRGIDFYREHGRLCTHDGFACSRRI